MAIDGWLDCVDDQSWQIQPAIERGTLGYTFAEAAVEGALLEYALADRLYVDGAQGTVVIDGREIVHATATELVGGTWVLASVAGCSGNNQPDMPVGRLAGECPTTGADISRSADVVHLGGRTYVRVNQQWPLSELGEVVARTRCRLQDGMWPDGVARSRDTGQLPPGTELHTTFLEVEWDRLGIDIPAPPDAYIDNTESFPSSQNLEFSGPSAILDAVPDVAVDTGLTEDGVRLWVAQDGALIWFQHPDRVEQWPVLRSGCA
ncbi:MAG: hypothetical protein ACR2HR_16620 [Euzebya sp.]